MEENENSTLKRFMKEFKEHLFWKAMEIFGKVDSYPMTEEIWEAYLESMGQDLKKSLIEDTRDWKATMYRYLRITQNQLDRQRSKLDDEEKKKLLFHEIEIYEKLIKELTLKDKE